MSILDMSKAERKKYIKEIEKNLKNYNNYKIGIKNIEKKLNYMINVQGTASNSNQETSSKSSSQSVTLLKNELSHLTILTESIEMALKELTRVEQQFIDCRYFKNWSIEKSAMEIGYSDKALFAIRNQTMDKLLISLASVIL